MHLLPTISLAVALFAAAVGCSNASSTPREPDAYLGCSTDENWRTFDEQERAHLAKMDDTQATYFLPPFTSGATLPAGTPPTFTWQPTKTISGKMNGDASCTSSCSLCDGGTPCVLCGMHLPAVSGDVYDLQFSVAGAVVYRIMTTLQFFAPPADLWSSFRARSVSLQTVRAVLTVNAIAESDGGPFQAPQPLLFTVGN